MSIMSTVCRSGAALLMLAAGFTSAAPAQSRGELLYTTHCISCHSAQIHWRASKSVTDWASLKAQVRRWQGTASLAWNDADIAEVSRYLNDTVYHFDASTGPQSALGAAPGGTRVR